MTRPLPASCELERLVVTAVSKNDDPDGCPATVLGPCEPVCARCGRDIPDGADVQTLAVENGALRDELAEARVTIRALVGVPNSTDPPQPEPAAAVAALDLVRWLATLDEPVCAAERATVTLTQISNKAREALARRWSS